MDVFALTPCSAEFLSIYRPFCPLSVHSVHWTYERPLRSGGSIRRDMASTKRTEALYTETCGCARAADGPRRAIRCAWGGCGLQATGLPEWSSFPAGPDRKR